MHDSTIGPHHLGSVIRHFSSSCFNRCYDLDILACLCPGCVLILNPTVRYIYTYVLRHSIYKTRHKCTTSTSTSIPDQTCSQHDKHVSPQEPMAVWSYAVDGFPFQFLVSCLVGCSRPLPSCHSSCAAAASPLTWPGQSKTETQIHQ